MVQWRENKDKKISLLLDFAIEIIPYIGVAFPFMGWLSLDRHHFYFLMVLKETLTFLSLSNRFYSTRFPTLLSLIGKPTLIVLQIVFES